MQLSKVHKTTLVSIGKKIKEIRDRTGMKEEILADAIGKSQPVLSKIEQGKYHSLKVELLLKIIEVLAASFSEFFKDDDTDPI